ncbi:MAG: PIN domain-containing protein [Candidatus Marinimicrobia bacterium]|nr:PIN domain-containing protein [Candidatus Neomarinimicrobiota bacterium]
MILNDTSVWIECFRNRLSPVAQFVQGKIKDDEIVYNGIVLGELLQGVKSRSEYDKIKGGLSVLPYVEFDYATWVKGGEIGYNLRRKGRTIPLADCLIAAQCLQAGYELFTTDKDFDEIAKEYSLTLVTI